MMSDKPPPYQSPQGYAAPQQGYAAPQQGYAPSQHGYALPPQGYATPPQGYGPPPQGYFPHPPQHVYNAHQQGYAPPPQQVHAPGMHSSHSSTTVVVGGGVRTAPVVVTPVHERFADKILLNLLISLIFWPWVIVWLFMCAFEKRV